MNIKTHINKYQKHKAYQDKYSYVRNRIQRAVDANWKEIKAMNETERKVWCVLNGHFVTPRAYRFFNKAVANCEEIGTRGVKRRINEMREFEDSIRRRDMKKTQKESKPERIERAVVDRDNSDTKIRVAKNKVQKRK